jgi:tetratricopeptide (TPR) repeat protein
MGNNQKSAFDIDGVVTLVAVVTAIASFLIAELYETDMWWHITIGDEIIRTLHIPFSDHFTVAGFGREYHDSHWLFQIVLALLHRLWGMGGVEGLMTVVWGVTFFICFRTMPRHVPLTVRSMLLFLASMAASMRFLPRPEMVTFLFIAIFFSLLKDGKYRNISDLSVFGLLQVVWANCHGLFVIGPFMAACYWIVAAYRRLRTGKGDFIALTQLLGVLIAATVLTPFGARGWEYAVLLAREATPNSSMSLRTVGELGPTFSKASMLAPAFWFFVMLLSLVIMSAVLSAKKRTLCPERLLIVLALGIAALTGRRNMPLFALVAAPFIAEQLPVLFTHKIKWARPLTLAAALAAFSWALFPLSGKYYVLVMTPARFGWGVTPSYYPHGLPPFLKKIAFKGNVYASDGLGGFFMYHFYPQLLPLSDGRWEVYDRQVLEAIRSAPLDPLIWQQLVDTYDIKGVLLQHASLEAKGLVPRLRVDPRWRLIYYDNAASFWVRSDQSVLTPVLDLTGARTSLPRAPRVDDALILDHFYKNMEAWELRVGNLEQVLAFGWKYENTLVYIADSYMMLGRWDDAEKTFTQLISKFSTNALALRELAFLSYRRGDIAASKSYLRRAAASDPNNPLVLRLQNVIGN